jgi:hypothetical protein
VNDTVAHRSGKPARARAGEGECSYDSTLTGTDPPTEPAAVPTMTVTVVGARGGHAASTVAAALALFAAEQTPIRLETHDLSGAAALLGLPEPDAGSLAVTPSLTLQHEHPDSPQPARVVVHDAGRLGARCRGTTLAVLRGPCYVGLRSLIAEHGGMLHGIVVVAEPGRSLEARDVEDVTGVPVVAVVPASARVARTIDAGLLVTRLPQLREFVPLHRCLSDLIASTGVLDSSRATELVTPSHPPEPVSRIATDLPVALSATGRGTRGCRASARRRAFPSRDSRSVSGGHGVECRQAEPGGDRVLHR